MVNAYMYQTAGTGGQQAAPGQGPPPNTSPPYTNYQPTPTQGYQVRAAGNTYGLTKSWNRLQSCYLLEMLSKIYRLPFERISRIGFVLKFQNNLSWNLGCSLDHHPAHHPVVPCQH